jgi:parallel beta-helix repeat protein
MNMSLRFRFFLIVTLVAVMLIGGFFIVTPFARAASFAVDSALDTSDATPGDGICDDGAGNCTFRAAIEEANALAGHDTITFSITGTITPTGTMFILSDEAGVTITGPGPGLLTIDGISIVNTVFLGMTNILAITGDNNIISGFTLDNADSIAIGMTGSNNNAFSNMIITHSDANGVEAVGSSNNTFTNMQFIDNDFIGIRLISDSNFNSVTNSVSSGNLHSGMTTFTSHDNTFSNNTLTNNDNGMYIIQSGDNTITNNTITGSVQVGINVFDTVATSGNNISGNTITGASGSVGIYVDQSAGANTLENNTISGTNAAIRIALVLASTTVTGNTLTGNESGIIVNSSAVDSVITNNTISNNAGGISVQSTASNTVIDGNTILNNSSTGIQIAGGTNTTITDNTISGSDASGFSAGIFLLSGSTTIQGNRIGTNTSGVIQAGFENTNGIFVAPISVSVTDVLIGGTNSADKNIIAGNTNSVTLFGFGANAVSVSILGNTIFGNASNFGIDLAALSGGFVPSDTGPNTNDAGDADTGANNYLNTPIINVADAAEDEIVYTYDVPAGNYRIEFFKNPTAGTFGEGETYIGSDTFISTGPADSKLVTTITLNPGDFITATITEDLGGNTFGPTSEFSRAYDPEGIIGNPYPPTPTPTPSPSGGGIVPVSIIVPVNPDAPTTPSVGTSTGEVGTTIPVTPTATNPTLVCPMFTGYYKKGSSGLEVRKIQAFLNKEIEAKLPVNGNFGPATEQAVKKFQEKYKAEIISPWETLPASTGYWYKTTRMKANQLSGCIEASVILDILGKVWVLSR